MATTLDRNSMLSITLQYSCPISALRDWTCWATVLFCSCYHQWSSNILSSVSSDFSN